MDNILLFDIKNSYKKLVSIEGYLHYNYICPISSNQNMSIYNDYITFQKLIFIKV